MNLRWLHERPKPASISPPPYLLAFWGLLDNSFQIPSTGKVTMMCLVHFNEQTHTMCFRLCSDKLLYIGDQQNCYVTTWWKALQKLSHALGTFTGVCALTRSGLDSPLPSTMWGQLPLHKASRQWVQNATTLTWWHVTPPLQRYNGTTRCREAGNRS